MDHPSWYYLLKQLVATRDANDYRSEPDRNEARLDMIESILQSVLEKLRDQSPER